MPASHIVYTVISGCYLSHVSGHCKVRFGHSHLQLSKNSVLIGQLFCGHCRLENLMLVPSSVASRWCGHITHQETRVGKDHHVSNVSSQEQDMSLYHLAMQQLPFDPEDEFVESLCLRYYNEDGQLVEEDDDCHTYYECR